MLGRTGYFVEKAIGSIRTSPGLTLLTSATIAASLLVLGTYVMALQNIEGLALVWGRTASVTAYLEEGLTRERWGEIARELGTLEGVSAARLVTPDDALERFRARGPRAAALVEGVTAEVLPAAVELELRPGFTDLALIEDIAEQLRAREGIELVDYGREEFDRLQALLGVLRTGGLIAGLLIAIATSFIVANTIRLIVYARREEIIIQRLVGATGWFVRSPFLLEGALWGLSGGLAAAGLLYACEIAVAPRLSLAVADVLGGLDIRLFAPRVAAAMVGAGFVLGVLGSGLAVRRFLDVEGSDLG